jgi:hypothetical protein
MYVLKKEKNNLKNGINVRCWWLTLVILATQEADLDQEDHGSKPAPGK